MVNDLHYADIKFSVTKNDCNRIEQKNNICIKVFYYEDDLVYPVYVSNKKFKNCMVLLMITEENESHCVYIKDFNRFMCNKTKNDIKKHFCRYCLQCFSNKKVLNEHKENCLKINGNQSVILKSGSITFKNYLKQLVVPFKIYADFESPLKGVQCDDRNNNTSYT